MRRDAMTHRPLSKTFSADQREGTVMAGVEARVVWPLRSRSVPAGSEIARWSAKVLLVTAVVVLIGGAIWYARAATVPLIVAALVGTQMLPLIDWAVSRGVRRGVAVAAGMLGVLVIAAGLAWVFLDALFGQIGAVGRRDQRGHR